MSRARRGLALCACSLALGGIRNAPGAVLPEAPAWSLSSTPAMTVFSQADDEQTRKITTALSEFRRALSDVAPGLALPDDHPIVVFAFRNPEAMRPYEPAGIESTPGLLGGFYLGDKRGGFVGLRAYLPGNPLETVFHEMLHAAQFRTYESLPLWLQEGQADYYSTLRLAGTRIEVGTPPAAHVQWFGAHRPAALRTLFNVTARERARFTSDEALSLYATSWAFVHFLRHSTPERRVMFEKYQAELAAGVPEAKAHLRAFGMDWLALETAFRAYVAASNFVSESIERKAPPPPPAAGPLVPAPRSRLLAALGRLLLAPSPPNLPAAQEHLRAAQAQAPEEPEILAALGAFEYRSGRCAEAAPLYRRAVAAAGVAPATLLEGAAALLCLPDESSMTPVSFPPKPDPAAREQTLLAREWLRRGLGAFPGDVPALAALGLTYVILEDDPDPGIAALEAALRAAPRRADSAWNLMVLYLRKGERTKAAALVDGPIADRLSRSDVARARRQLLDFDLKRAFALLNEGRPDDAVAALLKLAADARDPDTKALIESELARVQGHVQRQREIDAYNAATELARKGRAAEALRAFRELLQGCRDPEVCQQAKAAERRLANAGR